MASKRWTEDGRANLYYIAGPNGAGKTTFALRYLPDVAGHRRFVNADLIAAGLSPLAPEAGLVQASRLILSEIEAHIRSREDFDLETTLMRKPANIDYIRGTTLRTFTR